jgi:hypothetical protein
MLGDNLQMHIIATDESQCDERAEGCLKCEQKGLTCPGYDNTLDRLFHNESAHVEQKAKKAKARALVQQQEREVTRAVYALKVQEAIGVPLLLPLIDQGISFFMSRYSVGLEQPSMQSNTFNKHLSTHGFHPIVATPMTALGLAGIANLCRDANFKRESMRWYSKALKMTNNALMAPKDYKSDNTLLATLLLTMFETTTNERSLEAWVTHVDG